MREMREGAGPSSGAPKWPFCEPLSLPEVGELELVSFGAKTTAVGPSQLICAPAGEEVKVSLPLEISLP